MPCWQCLPQFLADTKFNYSDDVMHTPFQIGHNIDQSAFVWAMSQPHRVQDFNLWMTATHEGQKSWLDVYPFEKLCKESDPETPLFVDIGVSIGHQCAALKARVPHVQGRVILQDLPMAIEHAIPTEGVENTVFGFWGEQPIKGRAPHCPISIALPLQLNNPTGARAYYLCNILHDYPDFKCITLLKNTIAAMDKSSVIIIDDMTIPNTGAHWHATQ